MFAFVVGLAMVVFGIALLFVPLGLFLGLPCIACGVMMMFNRSFSIRRDK
jgi:hypothetical protein